MTPRMPAPQFSDHLARTFPVSVKGIVHYRGQIALLKNEREEWELPGGKLEAAEQPETCVVREIEEELSLSVTLSRIVDSWVYDIQGRVKVLIVTYLCAECEHLHRAKVSSEHKELKLFTLDDLAHINLPEGYRSSILRALGSERTVEPRLKRTAPRNA